MNTLRETILAALHVRLQTLATTALRGGVLPERVLNRPGFAGDLQPDEG